GLPVESASSHSALVKSQPLVWASVTVYVPGATVASRLCPSPIAPLTAPENANCCVSPAGSVALTTVIVASAGGGVVTGSQWFGRPSPSVSTCKFAGTLVSGQFWTLS